MDHRKQPYRPYRSLLALLVIGLFTLTLGSEPGLSKPAKPATPAKHVTATASTGVHTWALLVGLSKYKSPMIAALNSPAKDVEAIAAALEDPKLGGLPPSHVLVLTNDRATCAAINDA